MVNRAIFLDRDNTLIEDPGYLDDPEAVVLLPGVDLALKSLSQAGYKLVVVTNQSGIARGLLTEEALEEIHEALRRALRDRGVRLDAIYFCPYLPDAPVEAYRKDSELRKPKPGMLLRAARELNIDLARSWMVGDRVRDCEAGRRAGCRTVLIKTPQGAQEDRGLDAGAHVDHTVRNLVDAARVILRQPAGRAAQGGATSAPAGSPPAADRPQDDQATASAPAEASAQPGLLAFEGPAADTPEPETKSEPAAPPDAPQADPSQLPRRAAAPPRPVGARAGAETFQFTKFFAGMAQVFAALSLLNVLYILLFGGEAMKGVLWALVAVVMQVMALTLYIIKGTGPRGDSSKP